MLKDTIVIISAGGFLTGFKALAVANAKETMRDELASVVAFSAVVQFVANLQTFPYLVELTVVPLAATLGGMQVLANHNEGYKPARPESRVVQGLRQG